MKNLSLKNNIIEYIYQEILNHKYKSNNHIKEVELAQTLNVSRAPVREALNELVNLGILVKYERKGIFLKEITKKEILDTYYTKGLIEGFLATDFILNATKKDFEKLDTLVTRMGEAATKSSKGCVDKGSQFHKFYLKYSTNEILLETLEKINIKSHMLFFNNWSKLYTIKDIVARHQKIANALKSCDTQLVEDVIREHYNETGMKIALTIK
jgi:DNA-binding GntR family transcriptional regulator